MTQFIYIKKGLANKWTHKNVQLALLYTLKAKNRFQEAFLGKKLAIF